jgi:hypothetical protein
LQIAIIRAGVEQPFLKRRFGERHNLTKRLHAIMPRQRVLVGERAHDRQFLAVLIFR